MRHAVGYRKLGRKTAHRLAMFRNMVTSLILHDRIETTLQKAKELRRWAEWMITLAKTGTVLARRRAAETVQDPVALRRLFDQLAGRYRERQGGYTRILRVGPRHGDSASMAIIEYLTAEAAPQVTDAKGRKSRPTKAKAAKPVKAAKAPKAAKAS